MQTNSQIRLTYKNKIPLVQFAFPVAFSFQIKPQIHLGVLCSRETDRDRAPERQTERESEREIESLLIFAVQGKSFNISDFVDFMLHLRKTVCEYDLPVALASNLSFSLCTRCP